MHWSLSAVVFLSLVTAGISNSAEGMATSSKVTPHASAPSSFAQLVKPLIPAVVNISTSSTGYALDSSSEMGGPFDSSPLDEMFKDFFDRMQPEGPRQSSSVGSGFIIHPSGYIVTNNHLVSDADQITVLLNDNTELPATLVGRDRRTDIAVLKVEALNPLPFVEWDVEDKLQVGDWIIAIGNPFGLGSTVTSGIVSHLSRDIADRPGQPASSDLVDGYIQTDASINLGNSGGPMFGMDGKVVGVNSAIFSPTGGNIGIGFAVPADIAQKVVSQILEYGRTKRGWIGVRIQTLTEDIAESLGLKSTEGALVGRVIPQSPADQADLKAGDVILKVADKTIKRARDLTRIIGNQAVDQPIVLTVWRRGKELKVTTTVGEYEKAESNGTLRSQTSSPPSHTGVMTQGLMLQSLTPEAKHLNGLGSHTTGVLVVDVDPTSPAASRGIQAGDVIVEIGQENVHSPEELQTKIHDAQKVNRRSVLLLVNHNNEVRFVAIRLMDSSQG